MSSSSAVYVCPTCELAFCDAHRHEHELDAPDHAPLEPGAGVCASCLGLYRPSTRPAEAEWSPL